MPVVSVLPVLPANNTSLLSFAVDGDCFTFISVNTAFAGTDAFNEYAHATGFPVVALKYTGLVSEPISDAPIFNLFAEVAAPPFVEDPAYVPKSVMLASV